MDAKAVSKVSLLLENKTLLLWSASTEECLVFWSAASFLFLTLIYSACLTALLLKLLSFQALLLLSCCPLECTLHRDAATQQSVLGNGNSIKYSLSPSSWSPLIHNTGLSTYGQQSCSLPFSKSRYAEIWHCPSPSARFHLNDRSNCITSAAAFMCPRFCLLAF